MNLKVGLEILLEEKTGLLKGRRAGLIVHQPSVSATLDHSLQYDLLDQLPNRREQLLPPARLVAVDIDACDESGACTVRTGADSAVDYSPPGKFGLRVTYKVTRSIINPFGKYGADYLHALIFATVLRLLS